MALDSKIGYEEAITSLCIVDGPLYFVHARTVMAQGRTKLRLVMVYGS